MHAVAQVLTHDSLGLGEDGPTHQPVEHLASLRLIPHLDVWRPCDGLETAVAWQSAVERRDGPSALMLSRQNLPQVHRDAILPPGVPTVAVEAGHRDGWYRYVGRDGEVIGLSDFGASAPASVLYEHFGITAAHVTETLVRVARPARGMPKTFQHAAVA